MHARVRFDDVLDDAGPWEVHHHDPDTLACRQAVAGRQAGSSREAAISEKRTAGWTNAGGQVGRMQGGRLDECNNAEIIIRRKWTVPFTPPRAAQAAGAAAVVDKKNTALLEKNPQRLSPCQAA